MRHYGNLPSGSIDRAKELRRDAPEPERRLLRGLREAFPTLKWRHQVPFGPFYADLLCFSERLAIEVDGDTHMATDTYDKSRTAFMRSEGYTVIRFGNPDVMQNLEGVLTTVSLSLREREGAPKARKGEGERTKREGKPAIANSPSPFRRSAAPSLSQRERDI